MSESLLDGLDLEVGTVMLRTFRIDRSSGALLPVMIGRSKSPPSTWESGCCVARCAKGEQHRSPHEQCTCGIYGFTDLRTLRTQYFWARAVVAVVAVEGTVLVGDRGYRAEAARVIALWVSPSVPASLRTTITDGVPGAAVHTDLEAMVVGHGLRMTPAVPSSVPTAAGGSPASGSQAGSAVPVPTRLIELSRTSALSAALRVRTALSTKWVQLLLLSMVLAVAYVAICITVGSSITVMAAVTAPGVDEYSQAILKVIYALHDLLAVSDAGGRWDVGATVVLAVLATAAVSADTALHGTSTSPVSRARTGNGGLEVLARYLSLLAGCCMVWTGVAFASTTPPASLGTVATWGVFAMILSATTVGPQVLGDRIGCRLRLQRSRL